jgi:uncharacterized protein (DUF1330 family)
MAAYILFVRDRITDAEAFAAYGPLAAAARGDHPLKPLAFYGDLETLEGEPADGVVLLEFPTVEAAKAWYDSPAYQAAKAQRLKGADYRIILVQGVDPAA